MEKQLKSTIAKCLKNDRKGQFDLYHLCFEHLMRICRRYKHNREDALALLNEGFLKLLLNLEKFDDKRDFWPWASTLMLRTAIDDYRKNQKYASDTELKDNDQLIEVLDLSQRHEQLVDQLSAGEIREMIFALPEPERLVFNLYEGEGYQHWEIAEMMQLSERTTKRYLKAARQKLRKMLEETLDLKKVM